MPAKRKWWAMRTLPTTCQSRSGNRARARNRNRVLYACRTRRHWTRIAVKGPEGINRLVILIRNLMIKRLIRLRLCARVRARQ
jgi:hypothetical protein